MNNQHLYQRPYGRSPSVLTSLKGNSQFNVVGRKTGSDNNLSISSLASLRISSRTIENIMEKLKCNLNRSSTAKNYLCIWCQFNSFLIQLDHMLKEWEERVAFFCTYLIDTKKLQSSTLKLYISAIKFSLKCEGHQWDDRKVWLDSLIRSCKLCNDHVHTRFLIHFKLFELMPFELSWSVVSHDQIYLLTMYRALFATAYYGLMHIGEVTDSNHVIKASNIYIGQNKNKIKIILYSSKTHDASTRPQEIRISASEASGRKEKFFCPFQLNREYMRLRSHYKDSNKNYFVFSDRSPVMYTHARNVLKSCIKNLHLNPDCYNFQSLRIGRSSDLLKFGYAVEAIKRMGRWKSNTVYHYLRPL